MPVPDRPRAGHDVRLVRIQERVRQAVADPDEPERRGENEDRAERYPVRLLGRRPVVPETSTMWISTRVRSRWRRN